MMIRRIIMSLSLGLVALSVCAQSLIPRFSYGDKVAFVGDSITHGDITIPTFGFST